MNDLHTRIARARFRAWHRGTREADLMIGGFFDRHHGCWGDAELTWFEALLEEDDVDVMAWAMGTRAAPGHYAGPLMQALEKLDYIPNLSVVRPRSSPFDLPSDRPPARPSRPARAGL